MALPSLAFGIGLQGKPIDRAQLNFQKEQGKQKAIARKQEQDLKELEGYRKNLMDIQGKAYLPVQRELLARKTSKAYQYLAENMGNIDRYQLGTMLNELANDAALYKSDFEKASQLRNNPKYSHLQPEIEALFTESNPEAFNEKFANNAAFKPQLNQVGGLNYQAFEAKSAENAGQEFIRQYGADLFATQPTVATIQGKEYDVYQPLAEAFQSTLSAVKSDPNAMSFESLMLQRELSNNGNLPDLSTDEGKQQFNSLLEERVSTKVKDLLNREKYKPRAKGLTINIGDEQPVKGVMTPYTTDVLLKYGKGQAQPATSYATVNLKDYDLTIPPDSETRYADGTPADYTDKSTFNQIGVSYVVEKPFKFKVGNQEFEVPVGYVVPKKYEQQLVDMGMDIKAEALAWFQDDLGEWAYRKADPFYQSALMAESNVDKSVIERIKRTQKRLQDEVDKNKPKRTKTTPTIKKTSEAAPNPNSDVKDADYYKNKYKTSFQTK